MQYTLAQFSNYFQAAQMYAFPSQNTRAQSKVISRLISGGFKPILSKLTKFMLERIRHICSAFIDPSPAIEVSNHLKEYYVRVKYAEINSCYQYQLQTYQLLRAYIKNLTMSM